MVTNPHKLYKIIPGATTQDDEGNYINTPPSKVVLCDCFLHDLNIKERIGLNGIGVQATFYVNMGRRNDLEYGMDVEDYEGDILRGKGKIVDIKHTSILNYTVIYI